MKYDAVVKQDHKQVYLSRHRDAALAAKASADFLETSTGQIKRKKADRIAPEQNLERMKLLLDIFEGFVPVDVTGAIEFRLEGAALQVQGPCVYVAALYGKDSRWRCGLLKIWRALPAAELLKINGLSSHCTELQTEAARVVHLVFSLASGLWAGWGVRGLGQMSWPCDATDFLIKPSSKSAQHAQEEYDWHITHVHRNVQFHLCLTPGPSSKVS